MIRGSLPALVTPFKKGAVDFETLDSLVEWQIEQGSNGLVPVGTTGESPTLSHAEHREVVERVIRAANGRIPVVAGAGSNNTAEGIGLIRHAADAGANAALVVTPYYNKPTQAGLYEHFKALHEQNVILTIRTADTPRVADEDRVEMHDVSRLFRQVTLNFGYMEEPNVPKGLLLCRKLGWKFDIMSTSFLV